MNEITPTLEKILLNFASYAAIIGRKEYGEILRQTLFFPEPEKSEQLHILKSSISEIFSISDQNIEFREFTNKYNVTAQGIKEFLHFLGPESGIEFFNDESEKIFITLSSFLKSKITERLYDKIVLLMKLSYGKKYWGEIEFAELNVENYKKFSNKLNQISSDVAQYVNQEINFRNNAK